jgi:hypothetical protein
MHKTLCRNLNMKNQGNVSRPNFHHDNSTSESKHNEWAKMSEKEFRSLLLKIVDFRKKKWSETLKSTQINK